MRGIIEKHCGHVSDHATEVIGRDALWGVSGEKK